MGAKKSAFKRSDPIGPVMTPASRPGLVLAVRMTNDAYRAVMNRGHYKSTDSLRSQVTAFLRRNNLPDPDPFASIAGFAGQPPSTTTWGGYGTVVGYLKSSTVMVIDIVASDDIQDAAVNNHPELFGAVTGCEAVRIETILRAAQSASRLKYAEARSCPLTLDMFESFDTSGDLELNLESGIAGHTKCRPPV